MKEFFCWFLMVSTAFYAITAIAIFGCRDFIVKLHNKWFGISRENLRIILYCYLAGFKVLWILFAVAPYIALRMMR